MGWWRGGGRVRVGRIQVVSFCLGWEGKWVRLVFLFSATGGGVLGYGTRMFLRLRYSTGRGWSLKSELGEVMGGEGVRFLGVGGNGRTKLAQRRESELRSDAQGGALCHDLVDWGEDVVNHYDRGRDSGIEAGAPGDPAGASLPVLGDTGTGRRDRRQPGAGAQGARILRRRDRVLRGLVHGGNGQGAESGPD